MLIGALLGDFINDALRSIFFFIDRIIYYVVGFAGELFYYVANATFMKNEVIEELMQRIGLIVGLWVVFRLIFSMIQMLVNPDLLTDKDRGVGKLVTRVIVSIALLGMIHPIFDMAYRVQGVVLNSNVVGKVILGSGGAFEGANVNETKTIGVTIFDAFFLHKDEQLRNTVHQEGNITAYQKILLEKDENDEYIVNYHYLISTLAGGLAAWILLSYCLNLGIRVAKLAFLEFIAPLPILSYIQPKDETLQKWSKQCISTFLDVFLRLAIIYFAIVLIKMLGTQADIEYIGGSAPTGLMPAFVWVAIALGILMFAKQVPELIKAIFPSMGNDYSVGFKNKINKSPLAAGAVGLAAGAVGGFGANAWAAIKNKDNIFKAAGSALAGAGSAGFRGMKAGLTSDGKGSLFGNAAAGIRASSQARNLRAREHSYGIGDRLRDKATDLAGIKFNTGTTSRLKNEINTRKQALDNHRRNEVTLSNALNDRISQSGNKMGGLLKTFNGDIDDKTGEYVKKQYENYYNDYVIPAAQKYAESHNIEWNDRDENWQKTMADIVIDKGLAASESEFNTLNELYEERNRQDLEGKKVEKEIKGLEEDMNSFKNNKNNK